MPEVLIPKVLQAPDPNKPGAATVAPPLSLLPVLNKQIDEAINSLPADSAGNLLINVETTRGINIAYVQKLNDVWTVTAWFGKSWGGPVHAGATVRAAW